MAKRELMLALPESLAEEAEAAGLLQPSALEGLVRDELRRRRVAGLFAAADRLAAVNFSPLTEAEVAAEIQAARAARTAPAEKRADHARGRGY